MYEQSSCFDPDPMIVHGTQIVSESDPPIEAVITGTATRTNHRFAENVGLSVESLSHPYSSGEDAITVAASVDTTTMEITASHPQQMDFHMENENPYNNHSNGFNNGSSHDLSFHQNQHFPYTIPTPDLLNLMPRTQAFPFGNSSVSFENTNLPVFYDPLLHLNLPQAPPPPHGYYNNNNNNNNNTIPPSRNGSFVFGEEEYGMEQDGRAFGNGVLEFTQDVTCAGKKRGGKRVKQVTVTTERQRREDLSSKFDALKDLIPNPTKTDRASVVGDAIDYIRELLRTVSELKSLAEKKRHEKQRIKRQKVEEGDLKMVPIGDSDEHSYNESLRSSWIQRKSKDTEVEVRIIDDEVTVKLVQRKKINCLWYASHVLEELKLDLQHVSGGHIGDFCSFLLNSKICEGSSVYASAIASKLIEVLDTSFSAA